MNIPPESLSFEYYRASGPGGQNVNKVSTAVRLRFDVASAGLADGVISRLSCLAGRKMTEEGILIIEASRFRTRERNQADALSRLESLISSAAKPPKKRRKTRPTRASVKRRVDAKKRRSNVKKLRGKVRGDE
ncbi:MAG: aminoacyl-tRNA hydrolase [Anaerolineae bacterium]|jgi:ribosome-associated protein|nr:aminoacyl-tRNA hydrolase [Anaerolineae bacterium]MBT3713629.1 aminoacyl-tRNA hydrolase [Anaerolineae bacterium]MBT4309480.1 aminoacyl-tRNA hydrolase [Anaerolineae bacterium]MBT4459470.1 aminoacyl-tRNA hydrolase [Anaerolineae bacterium]MBT4842394.1 aminoacyl-tRNA hydrolase [Anaerolineae bacterium]